MKPLTFTLWIVTGNHPTILSPSTKQNTPSPSSFDRTFSLLAAASSDVPQRTQGRIQLTKKESTFGWNAHHLGKCTQYAFRMGNLPSGEAPKYGYFRLMQSPVCSTLKKERLFESAAIYCCLAKGSFSPPHFNTATSGMGFCCKMLLISELNWESRLVWNTELKCEAVIRPLWCSNHNRDSDCKTRLFQVICFLLSDCNIWMDTFSHSAITLSWDICANFGSYNDEIFAGSLFRNFAMSAMDGLTIVLATQNWRQQFRQADAVWIQSHKPSINIMPPFVGILSQNFSYVKK